MCRLGVVGCMRKVDSLDISSLGSDGSDGSDGGGGSGAFGVRQGAAVERAVGILEVACGVFVKRLRNLCGGGEGGGEGGSEGGGEGDGRWNKAEVFAACDEMRRSFRDQGIALT